MVLRQAARSLILAEPPAPADAIAVLGCALRPRGRPSRALEERLEVGAELHRLGLAPWVLATGGRAWSGLVEAGVMAEELIRRGVPRAAILVEDRSTTTRENARLGAPLLRSRGANSVLVVTQPFHLRRALRAFRAAGLDARGVLIPGSYQLGNRRLGPTLRDLVREGAAHASDLATLLAGKPFP